MPNNIKTVRVVLDLPIITDPGTTKESIIADIKEHLCVHFADDSDTQTAHDSYDLVSIEMPKEGE